MADMNSMTKAYHKHFLQQHDQSDCGVACLAMMVNYYGGEVKLQQLREYSGTTKTGTTLLGLYQACAEVGIKAGAYKSDLEDLKKTNEPALLHVVMDNTLNHYIVCWNYDEENKKFLIVDPAFDTKYYTEEELSEIWKTRTLLLAEGINEQFQLKKKIKKEKRRWLNTLVKEDYNILLGILFLGIIVSVLGLSISIFSQQLIDHILPSKSVQKLYPCIEPHLAV